MSAANSLRLYELVLANGRSASPFVWRIRFALARKGQAYESVPVGFTDIPAVGGGRFKTVPIIERAGTMLSESWDIATFLDDAYPSPPLFCGAAEQAMVRLFDAWMLTEIARRMVSIYVLDVHNAARPNDRAYFRQSREARFKGRTLEEVVAGREERLPALREAFAPMRLHLAKSPFLGGSQPNYADYIALGLFQWVGSVSTLPLLARDDHVLRGWLERGCDLYDGLGRDARLKPLLE